METTGESAANSNVSGQEETTTRPPQTFSQRWSRNINHLLHEPLLRHGLHPLTQTSARHPNRTMSAVTVLSLFLLAVGVLTNFRTEVDADVVWTPPSRSVEHKHWISTNEGFDAPNRIILFRIHREGANMLGAQARESMERVFAVLDVIRATPGYDGICAESLYKDPFYGETTCEITSPARFYQYDTSVFDTTDLTNEEVIRTLSALTYPDGAGVPVHTLYGRPVRDETTSNLTSAQMISTAIALPELGETTKDFEAEVIDQLLDLADAWDADASTTAVLEFYCERSFDDEFYRAVVKDIPLVPGVFIGMSIFTAAMFARRRHPSRSLLGMSAVVSVLLAILSGYGLLFSTGTPLTSMTQILPFVIFGIGLDDTFVVMGCYRMTTTTKTASTESNSKNEEDLHERIYQTVEVAGPSITLTTLTSALAFGLGCLSSVPAEQWLCLYAWPTILFVYIYTLTFFIAALVTDERRIQNGRRDCCPCLHIRGEMSAKKEEQGADDHNDGNDDSVKVRKLLGKTGELMEETGAMTVHPKTRGVSEHAVVGMGDVRGSSLSPGCLDRLMDKYAKVILHPRVKVFVLFGFAALFGLCCWSTSLTSQEFNLIDVMPDDSYVVDIVVSTEKYNERGYIAPKAYFRHVNQSSPTVQHQMESYVNDLVAMDSISKQPDFFWLRSFNMFLEGNESLVSKPFTQQLDEFLDVPTYADMFAKDIARNEDGTIRASRVQLFMDAVSQTGSIKSQIDALEEQQRVTASQPLNRGRDEWPFFCYSDAFIMWEFYTITVSELILTTVVGVFSVTGVSILFIPHWTAGLFVLPIISVLYVDVIGVMQWGGVRINPASYVTLVMSIGLLVDFLLHVLFRYYELPGNRQEKTVAMLKSVGTSVLAGGVSTLLGTIPLAFSTSLIFRSIFVAFLGLVTLGIGHGLVLLPVLLSVLGPEEQVVRESTERSSVTRRTA